MRGSVDTGDTCIVLHWFPWICFTDVSRPWIGSRSVWRLGLTVLIDNPVKYVRTQPVWRTPRRRVCFFLAPGLHLPTDYHNPQFGAPNQMR